MQYEVKVLDERYSHELQSKLTVLLNDGYKIDQAYNKKDNNIIILVKEIHEPIQEQTSETVR